MSTKRYRLEKLDMDEVSLVASGDDPMALQVLAKSADVSKGCGMKHKGMKKGETCPDCGKVVKMSPEGGDMNVPAPVAVLDMRHAGTMKRRKTKKWVKPYKRGEQMVSGYFIASKARDGDGDGRIYDGTPYERPAPMGSRTMRHLGPNPIARRRPVQNVSRGRNLQSVARSRNMSNAARRRAARVLDRDPKTKLKEMKEKYGLEGDPRPGKMKRGDEGM